MPSLPQRTPSRDPDPAGRHLWEYRPARDILWAVGIAAALAIAYVVRGVLGPILAALILAYLFNPLITMLRERWRVPRGLTSSVLAAVLAVLSVGMVMWGAPLLMRQLTTLTQQMPKYLKQMDGAPGAAGTIAGPLASVANEVKEDPAAALKPIVGGEGATDTVKKALGATAVLLLDVLVVPIYFLLFAWNFDRMNVAFWRVMPLVRYPRLAVAAGRMDAAFSGFFRGRFVIAVISAGLYAAGWGLTGVPYWGVLAVVTGVLTIIPYASLASWPVAVGLKYLDAVQAGQVDWTAVALWPSVVFLAVAFFEGWILTPMVQSQASHMSAAAVLIAVFIGGELGGAFGMLLAVPIWSCIKILFELFVLPKLLDAADKPAPGA
jgi:predicted PurR-regulated permease PerM